MKSFQIDLLKMQNEGKILLFKIVLLIHNAWELMR